MRDSEVVASIVAGDPEGLAAAYDKYAGDLYGYCQSLLREPNDAADAVQDTFVIAASKLAGLRDPDRLRAWLFAVARNECLRRLKSRYAAAPLQDAPEPADDSVDIGGAAERAETVALVRAAVGGLNDGERDVVNQLWHGLEVPEVAAVLGVSRNHAYSLFSRARDQLEASVGVLLVGRVGRRDCAALDSLLGDWDGRLTARLRKRVGRHIDRCGVCSDRRRKELTPALLYDLAPAALLAMAALRGAGALIGAGQPGGPLPAVRDVLLRLATDPGQHAAAYRAASGRSMQTFRMTGFPRAAHHGHLGGTWLPHLHLAGAGATVAVTATVVVTAVAPHPRQSPNPPGGAPPASVPVPGVVLPEPGSASRGGSPTSPAGATGAAAGPRAKHGGSVQAPSASGLPTAGTTATPTPTSPLTGTVAGPTATPTAPPQGGTAPGAPGSVPTVIVSTGGPAGAATLSVSPTTVLLSPLLGGSLTLTASGGPVSWSVSEPASLLGKLTISPTSGTLSADGKATVTIAVAGLASADTQLTMEPGGQVVTVVLGLG